MPERLSCRKAGLVERCCRTRTIPIYRRTADFTGDSVAINKKSASMVTSHSVMADKSIQMGAGRASDPVGLYIPDGPRVQLLSRVATNAMRTIDEGDIVDIMDGLVKKYVQKYYHCHADFIVKRLNTAQADGTEGSCHVKNLERSGSKKSSCRCDFCESCVNDCIHPNDDQKSKFDVRSACMVTSRFKMNDKCIQNIVDMPKVRNATTFDVNSAGMLTSNFDMKDKGVQSGSQHTTQWPGMPTDSPETSEATGNSFHPQKGSEETIDCQTSIDDFLKNCVQDYHCHSHAVVNKDSSTVRGSAANVAATSTGSHQLVDVFTMKPSAKSEFGSQAPSKTPLNKPAVFHDLSPALSSTKICKDHEQEALQSLYYLLSSIDGRVRRMAYGVVPPQ